LTGALKDKGGAPRLIEELLHQYEWFLENTSRSEEAAAKWISDPVERRRAFARADAFGKLMYQLIKIAAGNSERMRYLVM
jgi:hypothetical protein